MIRTPYAALAAAAALAGLWSLCGCAAVNNQHRHALDQNGIVFYLDGAGGGSVLTNWGRGVQAGLQLARYEGDFRTYRWQTGLGVAIDHQSSNDYKREQARAVAGQLREYMDSHPGAPVNLVALSAGTAIAVYALEELPQRYAVDTVVLLGSSLDQHYDLTAALRRVRRQVHVYVSDKDAVLTFLLPLGGTANRTNCGACAAGLLGFHLRPGDSAETRQLYSKLENIEWREEFAAKGNFGGHTDAVNPPFVRDYIAPLLARNGPRFVAAAKQPTARDAEGRLLTE